MYKKLASAAAAAAVVFAFVPGTAQAIVGGTPAQQNYKFIASLVFKKEAINEKEDKVNCGLTLVDKVWGVLPAACVTKFPGDVYPFDDPSAYVVHFGSTDHTAGETRHVTKIVRHLGWNDATAQNNIALVELDQPVPLTKDELPRIAEPDVAKTVVQVGWGRTIADKREYPQDLHQATERLLPDTDPRCIVGNSQGTQKTIPPDQYTCQAADLKLGDGVTCYGDAGGQGLQFDNVGRPVVISFNVGGGCSHDPATPDIGVKLSHYQDWINTTIRTK